MAIYLNTYLVSQAYGGPEEGGWWYETGEPKQSIIIDKDNDLNKLYAKEDEKNLRLNRWWNKLIECWRESSGEKKERLDKMIGAIEKKQNKLYESGLLGKFRRMAEDFNEKFSGDQPIEVNLGEFGGYSFVIDSPDNDDPMPTAYSGDDKYATVIEDHFAMPFPQQRPMYC
jgi:hypothetical protein